MQRSEIEGTAVRIPLRCVAATVERDYYAAKPNRINPSSPTSRVNRPIRQP